MIKKNKRIEIKRISPKIKMYKIKSILNSNLFHCYKGYWVNSLYFDTMNFDMINDHIDGNFTRSKYRLRLYNDNENNFSNKIFFEKKIKEGEYGFKERILINQQIENFVLSGLNAYEILNNVYLKIKNLSQFNILTKLNLRPSAFIRYYRSRFKNFTNKTEFNLDTELSCVPIRHYKQTRKLNCFSNDIFILEEKRDINQRNKSTIYKDLDQNMTRLAFSKYLHTYGVNSTFVNLLN
jgi:hypothetical protein